MREIRIIWFHAPGADDSRISEIESEIAAAADGLRDFVSAIEGADFTIMTDIAPGEHGEDVLIAGKPVEFWLGGECGELDAARIVRAGLIAINEISRCLDGRDECCREKTGRCGQCRENAPE